MVSVSANGNGTSVVGISMFQGDGPALDCNSAGKNTYGFTFWLSKRAKQSMWNFALGVSSLCTFASDIFTFFSHIFFCEVIEIRLVF